MRRVEISDQWIHQNCISARNAQLLGKHLNFPERLVECLGGDESLVSKTARFTEILYFLSKNRKFDEVDYYFFILSRLYFRF